MENTITSPLLPKSALEYFNDSNQISYKDYLRAVSLRNCLENIVNTFFIHLVDENHSLEEKKAWKKKNLFNKIESLKNYFPIDIINQIHEIRKIGNKGAHQNLHSNLEINEIDIAINEISKLCEWTLLTYFKKHGFNTESWVPTIFSTLPPIYRLRILEELFKYKLQQFGEKKDLTEYLYKVYSLYMFMVDDEINYTERDNQCKEILLIIDKLALAYFKSDMYVKSISFIKKCFQDNLITDIFHSQMLQKLELLNSQKSRLNISSNLNDAKIKFERMLSSVKEEEYSLFFTIFTALVAEEELKSNT